MSNLEWHILDETRKKLLHVAKEVETLRPAELVIKSHEFQSAQKNLDLLVNRASDIGVLRLKIGRKVLTGLCRDFEHDTEGIPRKYPVEPDEQYALLRKENIPVEPFSLEPITQPYYGDIVYFDLATIGMAIQDGGELTLNRPESS